VPGAPALSAAGGIPAGRGEVDRGVRRMADEPAWAPFADARPLLSDPQALRARAAADGCLMLRGLLPAADVLAVRNAILTLCVEAGWCDAGGRAAPGVGPYIEGQPEYMAVYDRIQRLEAFHRLALHPAILRLYEALFGEAVLAHPRNIARVMFPNNNQHATPAHQDAIHIRGTAETWTAWMPLGDCPADLGGLAVMLGSHREALLATHAAYGAGGRAIDTQALPYRWVGGDLRAGDLLTFHSHTIHQALPNRTRDRMRLSVDFRYQPAAQPVARGSLLPHFARLTWDEIYAGWTGDEGRYYWRDLPLIVE
jgi:hypothetical protein